MEVEEIKNTITQNYVHGAFNETDIKAFKTIFHPEFAIINIQEDGKFFLFSRPMWEEVLKKRKEDPDFNYATIALEPEFKSIEIVDGKASVVVDLLLDGKVIYTDFLLLVKIAKEWKIVSKIFNQY